MMQQLSSVDLLSMLPLFMQSDTATAAMANAISKQLQQVASEVQLAQIYSRIDDVSEEVLDELAWQFHVDFYINSAVELISLDLGTFSDAVVSGTYNCGSFSDSAADKINCGNFTDYATQIKLVGKRDMVKSAIAVHRIKGTPAAIEKLIEIYFGSGYVREWFEYSGDPYHFKVYTSNPAATGGLAADFTRMVNMAKSARSVLDGIEIIS